MFRKDLSPLQFISIFLFGVLPLVYAPVTQDPELSLRYLVFSVFLTFVTSFFLFRTSGTSKHTVSIIPIALFSGFVLFSVFSLSKTINTGDGIYEGSKLIICLVLLVLITIGSGNNIKFQENIPFLFSISALIFSVFSMIQLFPLLKNTFVGSIPFHIGTGIVSTLSNKNFLAETLLISLPFSIYSMLTLPNRLKYVAGATSVISLMLIVVIQSAAVYFSLGVTAIFMFIILIIYRSSLRESGLQIFLKPRFIIISSCIVISVFVTIVMMPSNKIDYTQLSIKWKAITNYFQQPAGIFESNDEQNNNSVYDRLFLARNSLHMASEHPVLGNGIANWKILLPKYGMYGNSFMSVGRLRYEHPHNDYLFVLCESGLAGLLFWVAFLISLVFISLNKIRNAKNSKQKMLLFFSIAAIISFMLLSLFSYPKERFFTMMMLLVIGALIISSESKEKSEIHIKTKSVLLMCLIMLSAISIIHFMRYRSEVYLFKAMQQQKKSYFRSMQNDLIKAESVFHIVDLSGTPLSWHSGQSYYYQGNHKLAFNKYLQASLENPYHMQVLNDLGALYEEQGNHSAALSYFNRVFDINPDFPDTKMNMVAYYFNTGHVEKAYDVLNKHRYKHSPKWKDNMKIVLLAKAEKFVQTNQDTALADLLNKKLSKNKNFLLTMLAEAQKDSIRFEERLSQIKK